MPLTNDERVAILMENHGHTESSAKKVIEDAKSMNDPHFSDPGDFTPASGDGEFIPFREGQ